MSYGLKKACGPHEVITSFNGPLKFASLLNINSPCIDSSLAALLASTSITLPTLSRAPAFLALAATPNALISDLNCDLIAILTFNIFSKLEVISLSKPGKGRAPCYTLCICK